MIYLISVVLQVNSASLCGVCPPGHYMSEQCTQTKSRVCKPCPSGTYNDRPNMEDRCMPCKICSSDKNQAELSACTSVQNTVCQCAKDYYYSTFFLFCIPCKKCELGSGVVQHCTPTTNTVCRRCLLVSFPPLVYHNCHSLSLLTFAIFISSIITCYSSSPLAVITYFYPSFISLATRHSHPLPNIPYHYHYSLSLPISDNHYRSLTIINYRSLSLHNLRVR